MKTAIVMSVALVIAGQAMAQKQVYLDRFEVIGWTDDVVAIREIYDASVMGGGPQAADCKYPGVKAPGQGVKLHFLAYESEIPLEVVKALQLGSTKSFVIYESTVDPANCTTPAISKSRLSDAKAHAAAIGIDLDAKPKLMPFGKAEAFATDCFIGRPAAACAGTLESGGMRLKYRLTSSTVRLNDRPQCSIIAGRIEHGCASALRVDAEVGRVDTVRSVSAVHAGEVASGGFDFAGFEGYWRGEESPNWVLKLNFRRTFLSVRWEEPVVVVLPTKD